MGVHSYDILRNPIYTERFQYIPMHLEECFNRKELNFDGDLEDSNNEAQSDLVRIALFLPFMPSEV